MRLRIDKNTLSTPEWAAFISTAIIGIIVHLFAFVNPLHNYDDINEQPIGYGSSVPSGRWVLKLMGDFNNEWLGGYNLPLVNCLIYVLCIAAAAGFIVSIFKIKNKLAGALVGAALITFPTATVTMIFTFTAPYYGIAFLMTVMAAWILPKRKAYGFALSVVMIVISLAIYQAYIPVTITIYVLLLIQMALEEDMTLWQLVRRGIYECASLIAGMLIYFLSVRMTLDIYDRNLYEIQGLDEMGHISIKELPGLVVEAYKTLLLIPIKDHYELAPTKMLKAAYLLLGLIVLAAVIYTLIKKKKKPEIIAFTLVMCMLLPLAINFIVVMCPDSIIYPMMLHAVAMIPCVAAVIMQAIPHDSGHKIIKYVQPIAVKATAIVIFIFVFCNAYMANANYTSLYYTTRQAENYLSGLVAQVRMTEGYDTEKEWALIGNISDPLLNGTWKDVPRYKGNSSVTTLMNGYCRNKFISTYVGYTFNEAEADDIEMIKQTSEYQNMPCWPNEGSIVVTDEYVIIKFEEE